MSTVFTNDKRRQKMLTLTLDDVTQRKLEELAAADPAQPGNRSSLIRRLIHEAHKKFSQKQK